MTLNKIMNVIWCSLLGCTLALSAHAQTKEPIKLDIKIMSGKDVNPDDKGRAAPIQVRLYELKSETAFEAADYFSLQGNGDRTSLAADLVVRDEYILRPGDETQIERKTKPDTQFIGVTAGYRELGKSTWRAVIKLPEAAETAWYRAVIPLTKVELKILIQENEIKIVKVEK